MLALRPPPAYSFQMDWSLDPKEDDAKRRSAEEEATENQNPLQGDSVTRQFEESLRRHTESANGFGEETSADVPAMRVPSPQPMETDSAAEDPPHNGAQAQDTNDEVTSTTQAAAEDAAPPPPPAPEPYDVENISNILKTFQFNRFINSSIIKAEVKEEPPGGNEPQPFEQKDEKCSADKLKHNDENHSADKLKHSDENCSANKLKGKRKAKDPALAAIKNETDVEAEQPCTSIKQRPPPKKKPARPRKNGIPKALENPTKPTKECAKRTSKRKTNYCEDTSSDDDKTRVKIKCAVPAINQSLPKAQAPRQEIPKMEVDIPTEPKNGIAEVPSEGPPTAESEGEIKTEEETPCEKTPEVKKGTNNSNKSKRARSQAQNSAGKNKPRLHPLTRKEQLMMNKLMETKEPFLQNLPCLKLASRISKCRECRCASLRSDSVFCRFYDFRRLRYKENAILIVDGFSDPHKDPGPNDVALWMPGPPPRDIDLDVSRFILMHVGDQFCRIWQEELNAVKEHMSPDPTIAWKKVVKGVREICDVCETTLFNYHWTCGKCGFGVCIDCYRDRKRKLTKKVERPQRGFDDYGWLVCTFREAHDQNTLMLTQIIPGDCLNILANRLHEVARIWKIPQKCGCPLITGMREDLFLPKYFEIANQNIKESYLRFYNRECEIKYRDKIKNLNPEELYDQMEIREAETQLIEEAKSAGMLPVVLATTLKHLKLAPTVETLSSKETLSEVRDVVTLEYEAVKAGTKKPQRYLPQRILSSKMSRFQFPAIDHDWLCSGKLLRLLDSRNKRNVLLFQEVWKRGQPVMFSELCKFLNISLWHPEAFCRDFGEKKNDLINCMTGNLVPNQPMKLFWEGFQCVSKRLLDSQGQPMLLKLKDWPPGDDFAEILPTRFADLMSALPMPEYTLRTGSLNIASRLPSIFVPPDLGPKMYNAYGSALHPDKGTTNLHLDISDAVNVMVYVGIPTDASAKEQIIAALRAIDGGGCDVVTRRRAREPGVMPGALWHIYSARDADKIRDLLNRVTIERGYRLEPDHDPIHDQNWYLDNELRERLYDEYGVEGYPIVQCLGDAVFIPAGAPHQVRNLHNCIKVAEDFVSPENIQHCFHLSQQFRKLSMSHTNHEDKLQIRNVIYHAVKDTTSYLTFLLSRHL